MDPDTFERLALAIADATPAALLVQARRHGLVWATEDPSADELRDLLVDYAGGLDLADAEAMRAALAGA